MKALLHHFTARKDFLVQAEKSEIILVKKKKKVPSRTPMLVYGKMRSTNNEEIKLSIFQHLFNWTWDCIQ